MLEIGKKSSNAHKIGMGKPLGLGSIQIAVNDVKIREVKLENNSIIYKIDSMEKILDEVRNPQNSEKILGCSKETLESFLIGSDFENAPEKVDYPSNTDKPENFQWFVENRKFGKGTGTNPIINQRLSTNLNKPYLHKYEPCQDNIDKEITISINETFVKKNVKPSSKITFSDSQLEKKGVTRKQLDYLSAIYDLLIEKQISNNRDEIDISLLHNFISQDHNDWSKDEYKLIGFRRLKEAVQSSINLFKLDLKIDGGKILRNKR